MTVLSKAAPSLRYKRHRFPVELIAHAVWLYFRFTLSLRDVEDLLAERLTFERSEAKIHIRPRLLARKSPN